MIMKCRTSINTRARLAQWIR